MKGSITWRLGAMFALAAFAIFALVGAALYAVLQHELVQREDDQLTTYLQSLQYSIERIGTTDRWARVAAKMDTLTPADGSVRFWVLSPDVRFSYGADAARVATRLNADGRGTAAGPGGTRFRIRARNIRALEQHTGVDLPQVRE